MGNGTVNGSKGMRGALKAMAAEDPQLAARMIITALPAAAAGTDVSLDYELALSDLGEFHVAVAEGRAAVTPANGEQVDFRLETDARTLAELAAGASPVWSMLRGRLHVHGKLLKARKLRALSGTASMRDVARTVHDLDPDLVFRAIPYAIEPEWTRGHRFVVAYELTGEGGGIWYVQVDDGQVSVTTEHEGQADGTVRTAYATWLRLLSGDITPAMAMLRGLVVIEGQIVPVTRMGRWLDRAEGRDDSELEREERQRRVQARRLGSWGGATPNGNGAGTMIDPAQAPVRGKRAKGPRLMSYEELYALWERQNWSAHELDFSVDREHWLVTPTESQWHTAWSMGSFYVGEQRVCADLAPFVLAAPSGEVEAFLSTQLVDEARHAVFFDRFGAEVMALGADDMRGRLLELQNMMLEPWHDVFDGELRGIANYLRDHPDDRDAFVRGVVIYHMVIEGVLAMTGQHIILKYSEGHGLFPAFCEGFRKVERDEHRHIAFGVRFLADAIEAEPRYRGLVEQQLVDLVPRAARVLVPPGVEDPSHFRSYDYTSEEVYGFAYRALKRRMAAIGLSVPPPEVLMPGPIDEPAVVEA